MNTNKNNNISAKFKEFFEACLNTHEEIDISDFSEEEDWNVPEDQTEPNTLEQDQPEEIEILYIKKKSSSRKSDQKSTITNKENLLLELIKSLF